MMSTESIGTTPSEKIDKRSIMGKLAGPELAHERCEIETGQRHPFTGL